MTKLTKRILVGLGTAALAGGTAFQLQRLFTAGLITLSLVSRFGG